MPNKATSLAVASICALTARFSTCSAQGSAKDSTAIERFSTQLTDDLRQDNVHGGIAAAVIKNGKVIWAHGFGYASRNRDISADTNTIYRIGSVTKTFTAALLMQLVEEGTVKLDDPAEKYVPEIRSLTGYSAQTIITLRQLASHTSGLQRGPHMPGADLGPVDQWESKLISAIPHTSLASRPGRYFLYSNIGFALLGLALERASGVPYIQMVQQRIFEPLHMSNTFFLVPDNKQSQLAEGISNVVDHVRVSTLGGYTVPCGGIYSTSIDLAKFVIALMGKKKFLSSESLQKMQVNAPGAVNYGFGLMLARYRKLDFFGHGGKVQAYLTQFSVEKNDVYAVVLLRNYAKGATNLALDSRKLLYKLSKGNRP